MPSFGTYDWQLERLSVQVDNVELVVTDFPYSPPSQEIAWVLDAIDGIQQFGVLLGTHLAPADLLAPDVLLTPA